MVSLISLIGRELAVELVDADGADIWAVNARTLETRLIIQNAAFPAYSHSGDRLAYVDTLHGLEVRTIDLATGDMRTVARSDGVNGVYTPRWSTDDKQIVFELDRHVPTDVALTPYRCQGGRVPVSIP